MKTEKYNPFIAIIKGLIISYGLTLIVMLILSLLITYTSLTQECTTSVALITTGVAVFVCGFKSAKAIGSKGWLWGIISGLLYMGIMFIIGFSVYDEYNIGTKALLMLAIAVAGGVIGGILGVNKK